VMLHEDVFFEHRDLIAIAVLGDDHELVGHAWRRRERLPPPSAVTTRTATRRADPAGGPAGGHLLLDRLRPGGAGAGWLRSGRLSRGRGLGWILRLVGGGITRGGCRLRRLVGGSRGRGCPWRLPSPRLPGALLRPRLRGALGLRCALRRPRRVLDRVGRRRR